MDLEYPYDYIPYAEVQNRKSVSLYNESVKVVAENFVCYNRKDIKLLPGHVLFDVYYAVSDLFLLQSNLSHSFWAV